MEQILALVAVENVAYHFDILYGYLVPEALSEKTKKGSRVLVNFGNGAAKRQGLVFDFSAPEPGKRYKKILQMLDERPLFSEEMLSLALFLKERTFCTLFEAARVQLPTGFHLRTQIKFVALQSAELPRLSETERAVYDFMLAGVKFYSKEKVLKELSLPADCDALERLVQKGLVQRNYEAGKQAGNLTVKTARIAEAYAEPQSLPLSLTEKQRSVCDVLFDVGAASVKELCYFTGVSVSVVSALEKKGILEIVDNDLYRVPKTELVDPDAKRAIALTSHQQTAFRHLLEKYRSGGGVSLLYGITGSGKTSVFLRLIDEVLQSGRQVIVMVPEISLTPQMMAIFKGRYGDEVAIFHSALSVGERRDEYRRVQDGLVRIAVGTRSAVFAPFRNLGLIVMDEEQEHTYKSELSPRYHARDVAKFRAKFHKALLLLSSATPSLESYSYAQKGIYSLETLPERYGDAVLPDVTVVDMKLDRQRGNKHALSLPLIDLLAKNLDEKKQSILLMNRRGYNTFVACDACGEVITCPSCSISLTYHRANDRLMCHYCGYSRPFTNVCEHCGKPKLRYAGTGTQRIEEELASLFPTARILRMDTDAASTRGVFEKNLLAFGTGEYDIMLGTQMVAKGLNFENVTLVGVINADLALHNDDYRSEERTFDLLTQVVGRSGRGSEKGVALVQTMTPENGVIRLAQKQDYPAFFKNEIVIRKAMVYPPYCDLCALCTVSENERLALDAANLAIMRLKELGAGEFSDVPMIVLPVMPPRIGKMGDRYRFRIIIKAKSNHRFRALIARLLTEFGKVPQLRDVTLTADINPENLM